MLKGRMVRRGWMLLGLLVFSAGALAEEGRSGAGRYEALPLAGAEGGKVGGRPCLDLERERTHHCTGRPPPLWRRLYLSG
ncbi:MAG TPA: hypothetical protein VFO43_05110 [Thiobacillus sp.]|nr:hypothetical protein [Thiobacillus sp.]